VQKRRREPSRQPATASEAEQHPVEGLAASTVAQRVTAILHTIVATVASPILARPTIESGARDSRTSVDAVRCMASGPFNRTSA
jgi:hypothetical protein